MPKAPVTVHFKVDPVNDAPVLGGDGAVGVDEGDSQVLRLADIDATDVDHVNDG